ncbi:MAG: DUF1194 domain-containing protein [Alphaproteobacteria bacterium]|nr:DUF1194 domain-containing protein [Alphaproteobacteria bacterium]
MLERRKFLFAGGAFAATAARTGDPVDAAIVLAVDSSSSVDMDEFYLQMEGYAAAMRHPALGEAIAAGRIGAVALHFFEFADAKTRVVNLEWRRLAGANDLEAYARELETAPRLIVGGTTAIGDAIDFAQSALEACPFPAVREVIDVSGDGASNAGRALADARADALATGITINGLPILNEEAGLEAFYRTQVIGGPGAFCIPARDYRDFREAIRDKLVREISLVA